MKILDYGMLILFLIALVAIYFFWQCGFDSVVTIIAVVIAVITGLLTHMQYKKIKKLKKEKEEEK